MPRCVSVTPVLEIWPIALVATPVRAQLGRRSPRGRDPLLGRKDMGHTQINTHTPAPFVAYFTPHLLLLQLSNGKNRSACLSVCVCVCGGIKGMTNSVDSLEDSTKCPLHTCIFSWNDVSHVWPLIWRDKTRPYSRFTEPRWPSCAPFPTEMMGWFTSP